MSVGVRQRVGYAAGVLRAIAIEARDKDVPFMARSVAFSAFLSVLPLVLLLLILATAVGGDVLADRVQALTQSYLTPAAQEMVADALTRAESRIGFSLFGLLVFLWGVQGLFRTLDIAFSKLYGAPSAGGILGQLKDALVVLAAIAVATIAMFAVAVAIRFVEAAGVLDGISPTVLTAASVVLLIVALVVAFLPMYYVFPDVSVSVREVLPGAMLAAVGWAGLQAGFQLYVQFSSTNQIYGAIGGVILLLTWLYLGAAILLVGGAVNVVLSGRHRAKTATVPETPSPAPKPAD